MASRSGRLKDPAPDVERVEVVSPPVIDPVPVGIVVDKSGNRFEGPRVILLYLKRLSMNFLFPNLSYF